MICRDYKGLFLLGCIIFILFGLTIVPGRGELFTPVIDGKKSAGEYNDANSYQIEFTDTSTKDNETGTVYTGRNASHYHLAFESNYLVGQAEGSLAFAITYSAHEPTGDQILDRKTVLYYYDLFDTKEWHSQVHDQNEQQGTGTVQNETNVDVYGAGGISGTKLFLEMSIPVAQSDSEPYDRYIGLDEDVIVIFTSFRSYYNSTENTKWGFSGLSTTYYLKLAVDEVILEKTDDRELESHGFEFIVIPVTIVVLVTYKKLKNIKK